MFEVFIGCSVLTLLGLVIHSWVSGLDHHQPVLSTWPLYSLALPRLLHSQTDYIELSNLFTHGHNFVAGNSVVRTRPQNHAWGHCDETSANKTTQRSLFYPCFGAKPLTKLMPAYSQSDTEEQTSRNFSQYENIPFRNMHLKISFE